ncbi:MAG: hypothetical protein ABW095_02360, partial [Candidatus Thiodiazotropha sp.]
MTAGANAADAAPTNRNRQQKSRRQRRRFEVAGIIIVFGAYRFLIRTDSPDYARFCKNDEIQAVEKPRFCNNSTISDSGIKRCA